MKLSTRAAIFSAIVFPGAGYFVLGMTRRAVIFTGLTLLAVAVLVYEAFHKAQIIAQGIASDFLASGGLQFDLFEIRDQIEAIPSVINSSVLTGIYIGLAFLWIFSSINCYRLGKLLENSE